MAASAGADERGAVTGPRVPFDPLDFAYSIPLSDSDDELLLVPFPLGPWSQLHGTVGSNVSVSLTTAWQARHTQRPTAGFISVGWLIYSNDCTKAHTVHELIREADKLARAYREANGSPKTAYGYKDFSDEFHFLVRRRTGG